MYNKYYKSLLNRIEFLESLVYEGKQVGELYHVCSIEAYLNYILPNDELKASGKFKNRLYNNNNYVSFTRNQRFAVKLSSKYNIRVQLVVDGNSLSDNYKVGPYNYYAWPMRKCDYIPGSNSEDTSDGIIYDDPRLRQDEEVVLGPIKNISRYIKEVRIDFLELPDDNEAKLLIKNKSKLANCIYYPFLSNGISKYDSNIKLKKGDSIDTIINSINNEIDLDKIMVQMNKYIYNLDYNSINDVLSDEGCREYFKKYGGDWMRELVKLYRYAFDERNGKCENQDIIKTFKVILDNDIDVTKFSYLDDWGNKCNIFKVLPEYGSFFDKKESELAKLIKSYL